MGQHLALAPVVDAASVPVVPDTPQPSREVVLGPEGAGDHHAGARQRCDFGQDISSQEDGLCDQRNRSNCIRGTTSYSVIL